MLPENLSVLPKGIVKTSCCFYIKKLMFIETTPCPSINGKLQTISFCGLINYLKAVM